VGTTGLEMRTLFLLEPNSNIFCRRAYTV